MDEELEPPPSPDIRPFGRISRNFTNRQTSASRTLELDGKRDRAVDYSSTPLGHSARPNNDLWRNIGHVLFAVGIFAVLAGCMPVATASPIFSSSLLAPSAAVPTQITSVHEYQWAHKPLLSSIRWVFHQLLGAFGMQVTPTHTHSMMKRENLNKVQVAEAAVTPVLVALSGMFAGLTLGYFSVDQTQLQVLSISGTPKQQEYARRIMPVRKDSHLLLTTLILGNMIVNEALPVVMDGYLPGGIISVVISTALVVIFAEIIPQSVCSRYGLLIGATMAIPVRVLIWFAFPIAWPIAKLLEYILGSHHGIIYRRSELRELIKMHAAGAEGGGDLDFDTVTMAQGALDLASKTVRQAMTPIDRVFMLPIDAKLDYETLGHVVRSGHSRIPVYQMVEVPDIDLSAPKIGPAKTKLVKKVMGSLLVKSCVLLDPEDATPLATVPINAIPSVPFDEPLTNMLNVFQEGRSHMAIVSRRPKRMENDPEDAESVMTAAAGGLRQRFMRKVAEISHGISDSSTSSESSEEGESDVEKSENGKNKKKRRARRKSVVSKSTATSSTAAPSSPLEEKKVEKIEPEKKPTAASQFAHKAKLTQLEQTVPSDAQMAPALVEKFFEGLEGAPLGIITLEDVLEELIGEEIYDEYDEHGGPRNAASAFVPREAVLAARDAALAREKALAESTPLPATNDADLEVPPAQPAPGPKRTLMPKLPVKFSLPGRRPTSQPGRSRSTAPPAEVHAAHGPGTHPANILSSDLVMSPPEELPNPIRTGSADLPSTSPIAIDMAIPRVASDKNLPLPKKQQSVDVPPTLNAASDAPPVSAVPARLLAEGGTMPNTAAPTSTHPTHPLPANMLSEALILERGRRRMAGTSTNAPPAMGRMPSAQGLGRGSPTAMGPPAVPSRQPTPPTGAALKSAIQAAQAGISPTGISPATPSSAGGIISPQPVLAKRKGGFKSVPTPLPGTPVIGTSAMENPLEMPRKPREGDEGKE